MHRRTLPGLLLGALLLAGCSHPPDSILLSSSTTGHGDVLLQNLGGGVAGIAVYRDGAILGTEAVDPSSPRWDFLDTFERVVDHPRLQEWRERKARLDDLVARDAGTTAEVVELLRGLPFDSLVSARAETWSRGRPDRAAAVLDAGAFLDLRKSTLALLAGDAVGAEGLSDDRLAVWAGIEDLQESTDAVLHLAGCPAAGPRTLRRLLYAVDELPTGDRPQGYVAVGKRLVPDASQAYLLVRQLDELTSRDQKAAALEVLGVPEAADAYALQLIQDVDEMPTRDRRQVLLAAVEKLGDDPRGLRAAVGQIDELRGSDRTDAALALLHRAGAAPVVAADVVAVIDDFYGRDRERVLMTVIDGPGYTGATQRACVVAAEEELHGERRARVLRRIVAHAATTEANRELARRYLED